MGKQPGDLEAVGARERSALERHVIQVQRTVRTCEGCGLCCTEAFNSVQILPIEARRIVDHLEGKDRARRDELLERVRVSAEALEKMKAHAKPRYRCPFLEQDMSCALTLTSKPIACLAFNPLTPDACDMEPERFFPAHDPLEAANRRANARLGKEPIPVAIRRVLGLAARESKAERRGPKDSSGRSGGKRNQGRRPRS